jgi:PAS domain S-box-containing protein
MTVCVEELQGRETMEAADARTSLLASIVDSSDDAITAKTHEGVITSWNHAAERMYGYTAEEAIGQSANMLMSPDRPEELSEILAKIRAGERLEHYETVRRCKDGKCIQISLTVSPIFDAAGDLVGVSSIARDVTSQRQAAHYARSLIEASLDPLVTISPEGKITDVNEATIKVTGVPRKELTGTDFSDYFTEPEQAREGYKQVFAKGFVTNYPLTIRHKEGRVTDVLYNASLYRDSRGNVLGVFAAAREVTALKSAEAQIVEQRARELERLAELERFQQLTVGRELKMVELKKEIQQLKQEMERSRKSPAVETVGT